MFSTHSWFSFAGFISLSMVELNSVTAVGIRGFVVHAPKTHTGLNKAIHYILTCFRFNVPIYHKSQPSYESKNSQIYFMSLITSLTARGRQNRLLRELPGHHPQEQGVHPADEAGEQAAAQEAGRQSGCE